MRRYFLLITTLLAFSAAPGQESPQWELILLKPRDCGACTLGEQILRQRGFLQSAELSAPGAPSITARVVRRSGNELTDQEVEEVSRLPYIDMAQWRQQASQRALQVLLLKDGHVAAAGNVADSADLRRESFPESVIAPRAGDEFFRLRQEHDRAYSQAFLRRWNFDWFYELALDPSRARARDMAAYIASRPAREPAASDRNLLLMSTASWPGNNEVFNSVRIREIRDVLQREAGLSREQVTILHGGDNPTAADGVEVRNGRLAFSRQAIEGARPATFANLAAFFDGLKRRGPTRNLMVLVGHGSPDGAGVWNSLAPLSPADLAALHQHGGGDDILVSGNCYGGVMARAMSCGFFAARPDIIATGCQADAAEVAQSRDYLKVFFDSLDPHERRRADADRDGQISFEEAHWFASATGDWRNVTYTTLDAWADAWFEAHPETLPARMSVGEMRELARQAPPAEREAVARMTDGLTPDVELDLTDIPGQAVAWSRERAGVRPMIAQLARRMLYTQRHATGEPAVAAVRACESRSLTDFLAP